MNTLNQSRDRLARLLATENIDVIRSNVATAAFDIKNRVLILPRWKDMTDEIEEMLMLHEVGHALYTIRDEYGVVYEKEKKHLREYANVIEDVRIERKMKERYPGSRKSFGAGYRQLNDRDFFGVKNRELNALLLIDRINIYYKVGYNSGVKFTQEEYAFVRRADLCETVEEVLQLAEEIYEYSKTKSEESDISNVLDNLNQELKNDREEENEDDSSDYDYSDGEDDDESTFEDCESNPMHELPKRDLSEDVEDSTNLDLQEPDLTPQTTKTFDKKLEELADQNLVINYYEPEFEIQHSASNIVPYTKVLAELSNHEELINWAQQKVHEFKTTTGPVVSYLIKEFEMKKSATAYRRARVAKLGMLDAKKLYAYKLKDDLFRQITRIDDGKKHGMIFLLDWSGSMSECIQETLEQVINLAMFCQRAQIPYQVFAFTSTYICGNFNDNESMLSKNEKGLGDNRHLHLLEFFSHKMTSVEFNKMITCLLSHPWARNNYGLGGTPLNEALLYMTKYVGKFIKDNQVEKMSFITLTDGEGGTLNSYSQYVTNGRSYRDGHGMCNVKSFMKDPMTKKEYELSQFSDKQTAMFMNIIRDRWHTKNIGFFLTKPKYRAVHDFIKENMPYSSYGEKAILTENVVQSLRKNKYAVLTTVPGRDEFYLLPNNIKIDDSNLNNIDSEMNAGAISRQLGKMFNTKRTSRVVLSKFIEQVS